MAVLVNRAKKTNYYINMGATLVLFAAVAGMMNFAAAASSEDHQDIAMVVDGPDESSFSGGLQHGRFQLPGGKSLTLSRKRQPRNLGCVGTGEECGPFTYCCGSLTCSSTAWGGTCSQVNPCIPAGGDCDDEFYNLCCFPMKCNTYKDVCE